jgi:hypothetical protein
MVYHQSKQRCINSKAASTPRLGLAHLAAHFIPVQKRGKAYIGRDAGGRFHQAPTCLHVGHEN